MRRFRWKLSAAVLVTLLALAYVLREAIYQLVILPLAYVLWLAELYYLAIPQAIKWILLILLLFVGIVWKLIPDFARAPGRPAPRRSFEGPIESLALGIHRSRESNYFKWQLANRLARLARRVSGDSGWVEHASSMNDSVRQYLVAGLNQSFVDFPGPRYRFQRRMPTPLDTDPHEAVSYLESQMELSGDRRP